MVETARLALPLLAGGQAQKHVTVNEALARLDAFGAASAESRSVTTPPADAPEGALHVVPAGATGAWAGREGQLAVRLNGGWAFARPEAGRQVHVRDEGVELRHDGVRWLVQGEASRAGAVTAFRLATVDHAVSAGSASLTNVVIPDKAIVFGVTGRVITALTGSGLTAWRLGAEGASGRYGSGFGCAAGSAAVGATVSPLAYFGGTRLLLEGIGGAFAGGVVRLCVHYVELTPPA